ncbi:amino acid ABC transporter substrate-binding protein, PAAT family (TC 3.A.1.3.-) [Marinomonas fungiae]|uniref:Amino acid ABC transporter substrate-binding protein, PAAT family (TC 3.A.1.3.-) n=2 Tax=Marinomonas fungiae TaxID=1137284 RepID=A0A0K6INJ6_9GAMM|nr:amino acid ABC transporter substrate-binding protein, PAAT family (TC 3.A.1.3.-) [Marinomonas fungiae]
MIKKINSRMIGAIKAMTTPLVLVSVLSSPLTNAYADQEQRTCSSIVATGNPEYPPFLWHAEQGNELHGALANLMGEISERINIPIETVYVGPWSRSQQEVRSGRVDLMAGAFYTSERADYMEYFSPAMMFTKSVVWQSNAAPFEYQGWNDLVGRWGVTVINNSFGQEFDTFAKQHLNVLTVASLEQALSMLGAGRADYVLYERNPGVAYVQKLGLEGVRYVEPAISGEGLFLTISKMSPCNSPEIKGKIADALRDLVAEGEPQVVLINALEEWRSNTFPSP